MQPLNNPDEENRRLMMALELYRLQSVRNMLLVVLMAQLVLIGIGVTLILQGNSLAPALARSSPIYSADNKVHDKARAQPAKPNSVPDDEQVASRRTLSVAMTTRL